MAVDKEYRSLRIEGMTCTACAQTVRNFLEGVGGEAVYVDLAKKSVSFRGKENIVPDDVIEAGIERLGYKVIREGNKESWWTLSRMIWIAATCTLPLLLHHVLHGMGIHIHVLNNGWIQLGLSIPVYIIGLVRFGRQFELAIRTGVANMDVLILTGSSAAFIYSCIGLGMNDPSMLFFETAAMIITLVLVGQYIEHRTLRSTTSALDALESMKIEEARLWLGEQHYMSIPANEVRKGDRILVNTGEAIPADGVVMDGEGECDEALITGEPHPSIKLKNDTVLAGSTLISGSLVIKATVDSGETLFQQIIQLVKSANSQRPSIQRMADKISAWFVPVVLTLSILTYILGILQFDLPAGKALMNSIAVIVISCPCAMGLATPTALAVGLGRLAKSGIMVKGSDTIERLSTIRDLYFDKTGTITTGELKVRQINTAIGKEVMVRQVLFQLETASIHPIATAIVQYLGKTKITEAHRIKGIIESAGIGVQGIDSEGRTFRVSRDLDIQEDGYQVAVYENDTKIAQVRLTDELRQEAKEVIGWLSKNGYRSTLLSGDATHNVAHIADQVGIPNFHGECLPHEKHQIIKDRQQTTPIAMIGDGINDAPALELASVGIAMSGATPVAIKSAKVAILRPDLSGLKELIQVSRLTVKTINENLFWAFSYNIVAIPIAAMGYLNPMWGALFMAFSDLIVIGNSLRLKYRTFKARK